MTDKRTVWGVGTSRTIRAHWALIELGLDYETQPIRPRTPGMDDAAFVAINPRKKVPVLQDGTLTISESPAIVSYLAERYSTDTTRLIPEAIEDRARYFEWQSFITMELDATSLYVLRRHVDLPSIYGEASVAVDTARAYFERMIGAAAPDVAAGGQYLLGDTFSGVDILMQSCLFFAERYKFDLPREIIDYRERVTARPGYAKALAANNP
jgi:glutathione S-transferase